jgi:hypothetical protein
MLNTERLKREGAYMAIDVASIMFHGTRVTPIVIVAVSRREGPSKWRKTVWRLKQYPKAKFKP